MDNFLLGDRVWPSQAFQKLTENVRAAGPTVCWTAIMLIETNLILRAVREGYQSSGSLLEMSEPQKNGMQTAHNKHIFLSHRAEDEVNLDNHYFCTDSFLLKGRTHSVIGCPLGARPRAPALPRYLSAACSKRCPVAAPLLAALPSSCPFPALPTSQLPSSLKSWTESVCQHMLN